MLHEFYIKNRALYSVKPDLLDQVQSDFARNWIWKQITTLRLEIPFKIVLSVRHVRDEALQILNKSRYDGLQPAKKGWRQQFPDPTTFTDQRLARWTGFDSRAFQ